MGVRTKRWNDPVQPDDGTRILITRYRPRGLRKERENWDLWAKTLAPSEPLLADFKGKQGPPISFGEYTTRYLQEMEGHKAQVSDLAVRVRNGETVTLLCASTCTDPARCHRLLLKHLVEAELPAKLHTPDEASPTGIVNPALGKLKSWLE